jgi:hypothetical protein
MRCQARTTSRIKIDIAVDDQQAKPGHAGKHGPQRRQLPPVELAGPIACHLGHHHDPFAQDTCEGGIGGHHGRRPGTTRSEVMHVHGHAHIVERSHAGAHAIRMPAPTDRTADSRGACHAVRRLGTALMARRSQGASPTSQSVTDPQRPNARLAAVRRDNPSRWAWAAARTEPACYAAVRRH